MEPALEPVPALEPEQRLQLLDEASARSRALAEASALDLEAETLEFDDPARATQLYRRAEMLRQGRLAAVAAATEAAAPVESERESDDGDWPSNDEGD
mmetsp:Transcript_31990/g.79762  ORF Transcript_31990/g.79762 Transcript_31990/m.79762 type:complete len:98 (-) Transcript_31990:199-492(-)